MNAMNMRCFGAVFLVLLVATTHSAAQGTFIFNNSSQTAIRTNFTGQLASGLKVALYFSTDTNTAYPHQLILNPHAVTNLAGGLLAGRFVGGIRSIPGVPTGSYVMAQVRAWDPSYGHDSWEAAGGFTYCRQYVVKGASPLFLLGPLGNGASNAVLNMPAFTVGQSLAPELCEPKFRVLAEPTTFRLCIDLNGSSLGSTRVDIQGVSTLGSTNWQTLTNYYPAQAISYWTDPHATNGQQRFYRVRAGWPP